VKTLTVLQHTSAEYLGLIEDHLEGRRIRFRYSRPFATGGRVPKPAQLLDGLVLLGGGPWGSAGDRNVPTLIEELTLTKAALQKGLPVLGIGLGAQLLSIVAGGSVQQTDLVFDVGEATRVEPGALEGYLPERFPLVVYGRDRPIPPDDARILAVDAAGHPAVFQVGPNALGFTGHPGVKAAIIEDLVMEFEEAPADPGPGLARLRTLQRSIEDALVPIMTGVVKVLRLME
jgi:GMP synthase-like glutamine amidotransferase